MITNAISNGRCPEEGDENRRMATASKRRPKSPSSVVGWLLLALCLSSSMRTARGNNYNYNYNADDDKYQVDDKSFYYNGGQGNYNRYYANQADDDANSNAYNYNQAYSNYHNYNNGNNYNNNDDGTATTAPTSDNSNANGNDDGNDYQYGDVDVDDKYDQQWQDDVIEIDEDGFDGLSISPVSCVNYNNGHFIKFEMYETENSYQCHFGHIGTFVVSIGHYMRAYFNYQALTYGNSFSLPDDVGYLECIPLKMEDYGFSYVTDDGEDVDEDEDEEDPDRRRAEEDREDEEEKEQEQAILYAKIGCLSKETFTSTAFQLHVYTDDKCTEPYDDGQSDQQHGKSGYQIDLDTYYNANAGEDDGIKYTNYPKNTLGFSTKVSFRPSFYKCQTCKPAQISNTFNKFSGTFYDDAYISRYGMTQSAYAEYVAQQEAEKEAENCDNCQYYSYSNDDLSDDYNVQKVDDAYYKSFDDDVSSYVYWVDDYNNHRQLRLSATEGKQEKKQPALVPLKNEFRKYEMEFWNDFDIQQSKHDRALYENSYGGVDDWNMCEQVYKYGLYCDEQCQELDAFRANQWSGADIILLSIMCTFIAAMMILVVAKHQKASRVIQKQHSFYSAGGYDPSDSGIDTNHVPGLPPAAMFTIFVGIMITVIAMAFLTFVNETLVFAVVCCILLFIYMLKITLFSDQKRPILLASPNHEDVFSYSNADFGKKKGFFS